MSAGNASAASDLKPGSPEAIMAGCTCDAAENGYGRGHEGQADTWLLAPDCPLHVEMPADGVGE